MAATIRIPHSLAHASPVMSKMSPETASRLVREYGVIVCADVPPATEFGIDLMSWSTGAKFKGVKMVPPGWHLLYYAAKEGESRSGRFIHVERGETIVLQWDAVGEQLCEAVSDQNRAAYAAAARSMEFDTYLGAYPVHQWSDWAALSSFLDGCVANRISPVGGVFLPESTSCHATRRVELTVSSSTSSSHTGSRTHFSPILGCGKGSTGASRTAYAMDTTGALHGVLSHIRSSSSEASGPTGAAPLLCGERAVDAAVVLPRDQLHFLGELQAAFVLFLMAQSLAGLDAWKQLVDVICRAESGILAAADSHVDSSPSVAAEELSPALFSAAFDVVRAQLQSLPPDIMVDELLRENFLKRALSSLADALSEIGQRATVRAGDRGGVLLLPPQSALEVSGWALLRCAETRFGWAWQPTPPLARSAGGETDGTTAVSAVAVAASPGARGDSFGSAAVVTAATTAVLHNSCDACGADSVRSSRYTSKAALISALQEQLGDEDMPVIVE